MYSCFLRLNFRSLPFGIQPSVLFLAGAVVAALALALALTAALSATVAFCAAFTSLHISSLLLWFCFGHMFFTIFIIHSFEHMSITFLKKYNFFCIFFSLKKGCAFAQPPVISPVIYQRELEPPPPLEPPPKPPPPPRPPPPPPRDDNRTWRMAKNREGLRMKITSKIRPPIIYRR